MKRRDSYIELSLTGMQAAGIVLMLIGLLLLFGCGLTAYRHAVSDPREELEQHREEIEAGTDPEMILTEIERQNRLKAAYLIPWVVLGGILVISSVPLFYKPSSDGIRIRRRRHREDDAEQFQLIDEEYDYPDDDFDYILDENIRSRLLREQQENRERERKRRR